MSDPDHRTNYHLDRNSKMQDAKFDQRKLEEAERPGKQMRAVLRRGLTAGYVYGTDMGHNNGPAFNAQPNDTSDPRHSSYHEAYGKVF